MEHTGGAPLQMQRVLDNACARRYSATVYGWGLDERACRSTTSRLESAALPSQRILNRLVKGEQAVKYLSADHNIISPRPEGLRMAAYAWKKGKDKPSSRARIQQRKAPREAYSSQKHNTCRELVTYSSSVTI